MTEFKMTNFSEEDLKNAINEAFKIHIEPVIKQFSEGQESGKDFLTRKETADFFGVSLVTLHSWVNDGLLTPYKMASKTYFKRSDLIQALTKEGRDVA